ncbi:MAG: AhpC/TSA family protein [Prevotella sp.]|nr:AhpC/TSA family protein [Prevotella sp.]
MKKFILCLVMAAMAIGCTNANDKVSVKGNLKNVGDTLFLFSPSERKVIDTVAVSNGQFEFTFSTDAVGDYYLLAPDALRGQRGPHLLFVAVPGETLELTGDVNDRYDFGGSKFYQDYHEVDLMTESAQKEVSDFTQRLQGMMLQGVPQDSVMKLYQAGIEPLQQKMEQTMLQFIKDHPDMEACATLVGQLSPERMADAVALFSDRVKNGRMRPYYQGIIDRVQQEQLAEQAAAQKQAQGVSAPDFALNDLQGKPLKLSSLRGKYVVLDFWGAWCGWCIKGFPEMKRYYEKYKGKFEILGIDCNDTEAKWRAAVEKYQLPWLHVYNPRDSRLLEDYGIQGFPTKIILSPEGKIVKTIVGEDPAFYTQLDELFGK